MGHFQQQTVSLPESQFGTVQNVSGDWKLSLNFPYTSERSLAGIDQWQRGKPNQKPTRNQTLLHATSKWVPKKIPLSNLGTKRPTEAAIFWIRIQSLEQIGFSHIIDPQAFPVRHRGPVSLSIGANVHPRSVIYMKISQALKACKAIDHMCLRKFHICPMHGQKMVMYDSSVPDWESKHIGYINHYDIYDWLVAFRHPLKNRTLSVRMILPN